MDNMNRGIIYIDHQGIIKMCSHIAKEITGIVFSVQLAHEEGEISEGDIVIIADNKVGDDDGNLDVDDLSRINIKDKSIKKNDMLLAIGIYGDKTAIPEYKHIREHQLGNVFSIETSYYGFHIYSAIDTMKNQTLIRVDEKTFVLKYANSVGNVVIIDGKTGSIKFFQAKGYSTRNEDLGMLLRGGRYTKKSVEAQELEVKGQRFLELFDCRALSDKINSILCGNSVKLVNELYEINRRLFVCTVIPDQRKTDKGIYLILEDVENLEKLLFDRNTIITRIEEKHARNRHVERSYPEEAFRDIIGISSKINEVKYMAYKASKNKFNVIITGESGTGKSKIARAIHMAGNPTTPFVEVNCNAIAPSLFESELFGYVSGAFTGARSEGRKGFFEEANGGTIFLDEIGEIPLDIQVKLLQVLQNRMIYRVGSSKPIKIDIRVIAATNRNLEEEVKVGRFRQDLYYRINVFPINIPPLRERKQDIYPMIKTILAKTSRYYGTELKQFSGAALKKIIEYDWPGNVRELENSIERAVALCESTIIYEEYLNIESSDGPKTLKERLFKEEQKIIETCLTKHNGKKNEVMKELDLSKTSFYDKLRKHGIE